MSNPSLPYDDSKINSILDYALLLLNKSLSDVVENDLETSFKGKGSFGQKVEKLYFKYEPNSKPEPDFVKVGMELKTTPLKEIGRGFVSKERLVFNSIDYRNIHKETFGTSSFWKKNQLLLLMFYLHEHGKVDFDYIFKIIRVWQFPPTDLKIIKDDWEFIVSKIRRGRAHELSEGDTIYLGACTKGANKKSIVDQPFSSEKAMKRAFSLKSKYLNFIIEKSLKEEDIIIDYNEYDKILNENNILGEPKAEYTKISLNDLEPIVKSINEYKPGETFEELVIKKFNPYIGLNENQISEKLNFKTTNAKNRLDLISKSILGISNKKIEEFEKAEIIIKTVCLQENNLPKQNISFPAFKYEELIIEEWDDSDFKDILEHKFFFVFFQFQNNNLVLRKVKFWNMPYKDIQEAKKVWEYTKGLVAKGNIVKEIKNNTLGKEIRATHFPGVKFNLVSHVRPHATKISQTYPLPIRDQVTQLSEYTKHSFWLNNTYVRDQIFLKH